MKSKLIGILVIMIMLTIVPTIIFAYGGIDTSITIGGGSAASKSSVGITERMVSILRVVGTVTSVVALIIIGMRYMFSSLESRAQMKGVIGYYIAGCILVFVTSNVLALAYTIISSLK